MTPVESDDGEHAPDREREPRQPLTAAASHRHRRAEEHQSARDRNQRRRHLFQPERIVHGDEKKWMHADMVAGRSDGYGGGSGPTRMRPAGRGGDNEGMSGDAWVVVLIVFLTMFAVQVAQFVWIEYLLHRIDVLEGDADEEPRAAHRGKLAAHA